MQNLSKCFLFLLLTWLSTAIAQATDIQIQPMAIGWSGSANDVELRFFLVGDGATTVLRTPEDQIYRTGTPASGTTTFKFNCTPGLNGQLNLPLITLPATTNAIGGGRVRWSGVFYRKTPSIVIREYTDFTYFVLPHYLPAPITWYAVKNFNASIGTDADLTKPYGRGETDARIAAAILASNPGADPDQTGNAGKVLTTNGTAKAWKYPGEDGNIFDHYLPAVISAKTINTSTLNSPTINTPNITGPAAVTGNVNVAGNVTATAFFGNGAGLTGLTGATGGVANTGATTIGADTDSSGDEHIALQTQLQTRVDIGSTGVIVSVPLVPNRFSPAVVSPAQLTANQNDYAPSVGVLYRLSTDASRTITGWAAPPLDGTTIKITNRGAQNLVLAHESASSAAANRFTSAYGLDVVILPGRTAIATYDTTLARWRVELLD